MQSASAYLKEYCDYTAIHGFRYFSENNRNVFERIWWFFTFVISLSICIYIMYATYQKWDENAIIITPSNKPVPLYEIPMPAITICPESKIPNFSTSLGKGATIDWYSFQYNIYHNLTSSDEIKIQDFGSFDDKPDNNDTNDALFRAFEYNHTIDWNLIEQHLTLAEKRQFEYLKIICDRKPKNDNFEKLLSYGSNTTEYVDEDFLQFIDQVKPSFDVKVNYPFNIGAQFVPLITDQGICYSYNILDRSDVFRANVQHFNNFLETNSSEWSIYRGYSKNPDYSTYPLRADAALENALTIEIRTSSSDLDYGCKTASEGFRMLLHEPSSVPSLTKGYIKLSLDQTTDIVVKPVVTIASDSVKKYSTEKRNCYFENERRLTYFKKYTLSNCQMECKTNHTLAVCDCVEFFMPRVNGTRICKRNSKCSNKVKYLTQNDNILEKIESSVYENSTVAKLKLEKAKETILYIRNKKKKVSRCGCLPTCSELEYKTDILQSDLNFAKWDSSRTIGAYAGGYDVNRYYAATLSFQFDASEFLPSERKELYGPTDIVANFGGLLGLFCGFSILSFIEILYFFSIRMIYNKRLFGSWTGQNRHHDSSSVLPFTQPTI